MEKKKIQAANSASAYWANAVVLNEHKAANTGLRGATLMDEWGNQYGVSGLLMPQDFEIKDKFDAFISFGKVVELKGRVNKW